MLVKKAMEQVQKTYNDTQNAQEIKKNPSCMKPPFPENLCLQKLFS